MAHFRWTISAVALCFAIAFVLVQADVPEARDRGADLKPLNAGTTVDELVEGGDSSAELVLIYVGSPQCAFSAAPEIPGLVRASQRALRLKSDARGWRFASVGVSPSTRPGEGVRHLRRIAEFDEISAGRSWEGLAARYLTASPYGGAAITPQLVVLLRRSTVGFHSQAPDERMLFRLAGRESIERWLSAGAQVPDLDLVSMPAETASDAP